MFDFIVIGGGIAGASVGARLSALGSVILLEAEDALAYHTSGRSAALYEPNYGSPAIRALTAASRDFYTAPDAGYLSPRGLLLVAGPEERAAFDADVASMCLTPVTMAEALAMVPILDPERVALAAHNPGAWDIDTDKVVQDFARIIRQSGEVRQAFRVSAISKTATGWAVSTGAHTVEGRTLVNAAGAWADQVATLAQVPPIGLTPYRRSMARIPAPEGQDVSRWPILFGVGETWYAKPDAGALIVSPAEEDPTKPHDAWADDMTLAEGLARYEDHVTAPVTRMLSNWAGLRSFVADRNMVLGPDPVDRSFIWCAAQGGYGFQSAPGYSQFVADLVAGTSPEIGADVAAALLPDRLR
ncbi:FAD-binding oxidoreductase [Loktanella sp. IMCC34160]|uniref:NAD(P)/FAD-dependent oxidoreductase n=1 Tax=Loktanella sp. IMCC34160 TaxID=2510646 RepID=UPI00101CF046|nr:FAD-dependent oxidoreductase [Loktanella sp. IMCC34160]RYG92874.1 FAD-binding oxidoreductase [Loktanella sp. IMCC34160]